MGDDVSATEGIYMLEGIDKQWLTMWLLFGHVTKLRQQPDLDLPNKCAHNTCTTDHKCAMLIPKVNQQLCLSTLANQNF